MVDGFLLVLSPWAVRTLRFDESLGSLHGYDVDFCLQARAAGRKVVTAEFRAVHNHSLDLVGDPEGWVEAHVRMQEKWEGKIPGATPVDHDWPAIARRARAEAEASRAAAVSRQLQYDAREREFQARPRGDGAEHRLAPHPPAAARELAPAPRAGAGPDGGWRSRRGLRVSGFAPSGAQTPRNLVLRPPRTAPWRRRRGGAGARAARRARTRSSSAAARAPACGGPPAAASARRARSAGAPRRGGRRGWPRAAQAAGCGPTGRAPPPPLPPTAPPCSRRRRSRRRPARSPAAGPRARRRSPRRRSGRRCAARPRAPRRRGRAARRSGCPGSSGCTPAALVDRLAVLGGDLIGGVVVVAARVRPADVVEQQQRQLAAGRARRPPSAPR